MKKNLRAALAVFALCCIAAATLCGCKGNGGMPMGSPEASAMPSASASAEATRPAATQQASPSPSAEASAEATQQAGASPSASDNIEGFMEGGIVNPDDVPDITRMFAEGADYAGMEIQSITYKLFEGRQAYYVVLQGMDAERRYYVFADGSVTPADAIPGE